MKAARIKYFAWAAVLLLLLLLVCPAAAQSVTAATGAAADTLRLEKTEGKVTVENKSGKVLTILESMKLFNGYALATELASYAYISLDGTKAVKMDAESKAEVRESGKKLEVDLKTGNLFFNVTAPLASDESLNIRTSNMVAGIRGTAGWIHVLNEKISEICLLSGEVTISCYDPLTGETAGITVSAGERAATYIHEEAEARPNQGVGGENAEIVKDKFTEEDIPGFVAVEIKGDTALQEEITAETELSVPKIIGLADERLASDEAAAGAAREGLEAAQALLENAVAVDPLFKGGQSVASGTGGNSSGNSGTPATPTTPVSPDTPPTPPETPTQPEPPDTPPTPPEPPVIDNDTPAEPPVIDNDTPAEPPPSLIDWPTDLTEVNASLSYNAAVTLGPSSTLTLDATDTLTIDPGKTLTNQGKITNNGTILNRSSTTFINKTKAGSPPATITGAGRLQNGDETNLGHMELDGEVDADMENINGTLTVDGAVTGDITNNGNAANALRITGSLAGNITNNGAIEISGAVTGDITNNGDLTVAANGAVTGGITNDGTLSVAADGGVTGNVTNNAGATLDISGTLNGNLTNVATANILTDGAVAGDISNTGTLEISGAVTGGLANGANGALTIAADATLTIADGADFSNAGAITNNGTIKNESSITLPETIAGTGAIENAGTLALSGELKNNLTNTTNGILIIAENEDTATEELVIGAGGQLTNQGVIRNEYAINNYGTFTNEAGASIESEGVIRNYETFTNKAGATIEINDQIQNRGTFTNATDATITGTGSLQNGNGNAGNNDDESTMNLGGTVSLSSHGGAVIQDKGTVNITGTLTGNIFASSGTINLEESGKITDTADIVNSSFNALVSLGDGHDSGYDGIFNMNGGSISAAHAHAAVYVYGSGSFIMNDGSVSSASNGGGMAVAVSNPGGAFIMEGGEIRCDNDGYGVDIQSGATFEISGGAVYGGGTQPAVYVDNSSSFTMSGGELNGGATYALQNAGGTAKYTGGALLANNESNITDGNITDANNAAITFATLQLANEITEEAYESAGGAGGISTGDGYVVVGGDHITALKYSDIFAIYDSFFIDGGDSDTMTKNMTIGEGRHITFRFLPAAGEEYPSIFYLGTYYIDVEEGGELRFAGSGVLQGMYGAYTAMINNEGTLKIPDGIELEFSSAGMDAAIIENSGNLTMSGGNIKTSDGTNDDIGVRNTGGTFDMGGGRIEAYAAGGAAVRVDGGTFNLSGDAAVETYVNSSYDKMDSAGVIVSGTGVFNMIGGTVAAPEEENPTDNPLVHVLEDATFGMSGGTIGIGSDGVYVNGDGANFTMGDDGTITVDSNGVTVENGTFRMKGGAMDVASGTGVDIGANANFIMSDGTITVKDAGLGLHIAGDEIGASGGNASIEGGVITVVVLGSSDDCYGARIESGGMLEMSGGKIEVQIPEESQMDNGVGVYMYGGKFNMRGGTIDVAAGTGVDAGTSYYDGSGADFHMSGGTIYVRSGEYGTGVYLYNSDFYMSAGRIEVARDYAKGVDIHCDGSEDEMIARTFDMSGGTIDVTGYEARGVVLSVFGNTDNAIGSKLTFDMHGAGEIKVAGDNAVGVHMEGSSVDNIVNITPTLTFDMKDNAVIDASDGYGVTCYWGTFTFYGDVINAVRNILVGYIHYPNFFGTAIYKGGTVNATVDASNETGNEAVDVLQNWPEVD